MENPNNAKLIKDRQWVENDQWKVVADDEILQDFSIISLTRWLENKDGLQAQATAENWRFTWLPVKLRINWLKTARALRLSPSISRNSRTVVATLQRDCCASAMVMKANSAHPVMCLSTSCSSCSVVASVATNCAVIRTWRMRLQPLAHSAFAIKTMLMTPVRCIVVANPEYQR